MSGPGAPLTLAAVQALVGASASAAYRALLLAHPRVEKITVCRYQTPLPLQKRIAVTEFEQKIIDQALALRAQTSIPFWQALFSASLSVGECSQRLLDATFVHAGQGSVSEHTRAEVEAGILDSITDGASSNIALGSKVFEAGNGWRHLQLFDFHCDISIQNARIVHQVCRMLMPSGFLILDSGDSYHACSIALVAADERIRVLGKALLAGPIVDTIYIGHQLQQDASSIRISRGGKARSVPVVVDGWCLGDS